MQLNKTALETLFAAVPDWSQTKVRSLLGSLGFSNDSVFKQVAELSGGEKARIALALIIVKPCNLLLLDEPTNHLDIPAKEMLEVAIRNYKGSLVVVSHDRYFISKIANRILEIKDGQLFLYRGNYQYYKEKKIEELKESEAILLKAEKEAKRIAKQKSHRKKKSKKK